MIGLVIPIFQTKYIKRTVDKIFETNYRSDLRVCIVNDGKLDVADYLAKQSWPQEVLIFNSPENRGFAGANNAGWAYLLEKYPTLKYLGTINDDTIPKMGWLDALIEALEKYPRTALAAPIMVTQEGLFGATKYYSTWAFKDSKTPMVCKQSKITNDTFVSVIGGFCFLGRSEVLKEIGYFDERYRNSCEDNDLCLKLLTSKWRIVVCKKSIVFHYRYKSRYLQGTLTNTEGSHNTLANKWGNDLSKYNFIRPLTTVHCLAFNQEHFIEAWVKNASEYADELIVMFSKTPWNYNKYAKKMVKPDRTREILEKLKKEYSKLFIVEGDWENETKQRNEALRVANKRGVGIFLIVDTDEFYESKKVINALEWMMDNKADLWYTYHTQLIKRSNWGIETPAGKPKAQFAIDLKRVGSFDNKRNIKAIIKKTIPEEICQCWHLSYLMPESKLREKLSSFGHAAQISSNWLNDIWPNIKPGIKDFHPVWPNEWKGIVEVKIPDQIQQLLPWLK